MGKIRLRRPRPRPARPLGRPVPPRAPPAPINTTPLRASPHSSPATRARRTYALVFPFPVFVFSDSHNESNNGSVRYRRLRARDRRRPSAAASRRRERRDPDVSLQAPGLGALHAQEQEDLQTGSDPACHRLHLRPAVSAGEPPRCGTVRRRGRPGVATVRRGAPAAPAATPAGPPLSAQHLPAPNTPESRTQKPTYA